ncbi:MAG: hypothetical protein HYX80_01905 [Chloroflexi bacterium]|nr:hypothetical protein [Chloroflexota bacterium]
MARAELVLAARAIEDLFNVPPQPGLRRTARQEKEEQAERVKRFLALPVPLQEGCLRYAQNILQAYGGRADK